MPGTWSSCWIASGRAVNRVQALEVAEQQHPEVAARRQTRPAHPVGVERGALALDEGIETRLVEDAIQSFVERVTSASRQVGALATHIDGCRARRRRLPIAMGRSVLPGIGLVDSYPLLHHDGMDSSRFRCGMMCRSG